ncbi:MAG TPA: SurA N-terminal domain-containing protein, partial [Salinivirga sp.]|uniref:SurA N-terminal domain-containing protein n=1 Tax=Salinivirga sp. TaxID=1970192 RepID=UPI002B464941
MRKYTLMKKIIILLLALSALTACNKNNKKGEFPPYRISETNADSIVETITYKEYLKEKREIDRYNRIVLKDDYTKKEQQGSAIKAFADLVRNKKLNHELNYLGITVTEEEKFDFIQGTNIHRAIKSNPIFKNPSTGEFDKSKVQPFIDKLEQNKQSDPFFVWNYQLNQIENEIKQKKYESLLDA